MNVEVERAIAHLSRIPFPRSDLLDAQGYVRSVDLALLDGDIAHLIFEVERGAEPNSEEVRRVRSRLETILPTLDGHARDYFAEALVVVAMIDAQTGSPPQVG